MSMFCFAFLPGRGAQPALAALLLLPPTVTGSSAHAAAAGGGGRLHLSAIVTQPRRPGRQRPQEGQLVRQAGPARFWVPGIRHVDWQRAGRMAGLRQAAAAGQAAGQRQRGGACGCGHR